MLKLNSAILCFLFFFMPLKRLSDNIHGKSRIYDDILRKIAYYKFLKYIAIIGIFCATLFA